jgi:hypothetical protein
MITKHQKSLGIAALILALAGASLSTPAAAQHKAEPVNQPAKQPVDITTLMDSIPDIIFCKDLDGVYRGGNKAWAQRRTELRQGVDDADARDGNLPAAVMA